MRKEALEYGLCFSCQLCKVHISEPCLVLPLHQNNSIYLYLSNTYPQCAMCKIIT